MRKDMFKKEYIVSLFNFSKLSIAWEIVSKSSSLHPEFVLMPSFHALDQSLRKVCQEGSIEFIFLTRRWSFSNDVDGNKLSTTSL